MAIATLFAQFVLVQRLRLTTKFLMFAGMTIALLSNLLVIVAPNYGLIVFALVLSGLGFGMLRPGFAAAASLSVSAEEQGSMAGLTSGAGASGFIFAPLVGNALYQWSPAYPYWLGAVLMAALILLMARSRRLKVAVIQGHEDLSAQVPPA
jgi:MFS family permease